MLAKRHSPQNLLPACFSDGAVMLRKGRLARSLCKRRSKMPVLTILERRSPDTRPGDCRRPQRLAAQAVASPMLLRLLDRIE